MSQISRKPRKAYAESKAQKRRTPRDLSFQKKSKRPERTAKARALRKCFHEKRAGRRTSDSELAGAVGKLNRAGHCAEGHG